MKKAFKSGLVKAASSTGAWIITGGTNTGVMRLVGEAVADEYHTTNLVVLGIATWGVIALREKLIVSVYCGYVLIIRNILNYFVFFVAAKRLLFES